MKILGTSPISVISYFGLCLYVIKTRHQHIITCFLATHLSMGAGSLALVTAPSSHTSPAVETRLAGGFDKLLLDSLYEDEARRQQIASATYNGSLGAANPFDANIARDPFAMSSSFAPPFNVQLAMMAQQQQYYQPQQQQQYYQHQHQYFQAHQQQQQMTAPPQMYQQQPQYFAPPAGPSNPFGDPFSGLAAMAAAPKQGNSSFL